MSETKYTPEPWVNVPYYRRFTEFPELGRPNEPVNDFEHPIRWALLAYWEKARADRMEIQRNEILGALERIEQYGAQGFKGDYTQAQIAKDAIAKIRCQK